MDETMDKKRPLSDLMRSTMDKIREMADTNTIVGQPITTPDGVTLIPISRVSMGFGCGGADYGKTQPKDFGGGSGAVMEGADEILQANMDPKGLIMLIPVAVLLFVSIRTRDIFKAVTAGLVSGIAVGLLSGTFGPSDILGVENGAATGFIYNGFTGMIGICLFCMALFGAMGVLNESGTMERMIQGICNSRFARPARGAEQLIGLGSMLTTLLVGGVTSASVLTFGSVADELGARHQIHPYRRANFLSGYANTFPAILPFISAFIFISASSIEPLLEEYSYLPAVTPLQIFSGAFYPMVLFVVLTVSILTGWDRIYEGPDGAILHKKP